MKSVAWHLKHQADGDEALQTAAALLAEAKARAKATGAETEVQVLLAEAFIDLARAHYRAREVDGVLRVMNP